MGSDKAGSDKSPKVVKRKSNDRNVGDALRAVYQDAVGETVPDEMLDLLKKLG